MIFIDVCGYLDSGRYTTPWEELYIDLIRLINGQPWKPYKKLPYYNEFCHTRLQITCMKIPTSPTQNGIDMCAIEWTEVAQHIALRFYTATNPAKYFTASRNHFRN